MASATYDSLNKAWKSTCRVLFGTDAGELDACAEWLREYDLPLRSEKSAVSGKTVTLSLEDYVAGAKFIAFDEINFGKKFEPLSINEIKDIDSLVRAVNERAQYAGSVILGHSSWVQDSNNVIDSHYVLESSMVNGSKYVGYSRYVGYGEYCFGLFGAEKDTHCVKCHGSELKRCFECHMVELLSDCYYCARVQNSHDCMFCFGLENGAYAIGNTALPKEKYSEIKAKLLPEIAGKIRKDGRVFSLLGLIEKSSKYKTDARLKFAKEKHLPFDIAPIDRAFGKTCSLLLGREIGGIEKYADFLYRHVPHNVVLKSPLSGEETNVCGYRAHLLERYDLRKRMATEDEMRSIGRSSGLVSLEGLALDLELLVEKFHPIAYTNLDKVSGKVANYYDSPVIINSTDICHGSAAINSKRCAWCFWPSQCETVFGSGPIFESSFCINNYYSRKMTRSFECDNSRACADGYFLHNCENVRDSMFCFNAKNLVNAIGNAVLPAEQYKKTKSAIILQLADELERTKNPKWDIFSIGATADRK